MNKNSAELGRIVLNYIIDNRLLDGFDKLELFDLYELIGSTCVGPTCVGPNIDYNYHYKSERIYKFKVGNFAQEISINMGEFSVPEIRYGTNKQKVLWYGESKNDPVATSELINFLRSDIRRNPNIIIFLSSLLKLDIEKIIKAYNESQYERDKDEIIKKINQINGKIHSLEKEKYILQEQLKELNESKEEKIRTKHI